MPFRSVGYTLCNFCMGFGHFVRRTERTCKVTRCFGVKNMICLNDKILDTG